MTDAHTKDSRYYHVEGVQNGVLPGKAPPLRKEFNEFVKDVDVLNLYIQALARIQEFDQKKLTSFFQVGGIHGLPYIPWDNVAVQKNDKFGGYCTHGSVLFPTWHRPYMALYEQVIFREAQFIADSFTDPALKNKYQEALKRLRQPYWDWAANPTLHPLLNTQETVTVIAAPDGVKKEIRNPLIAYRFHPIDPSFPDSYAVWPQTLRYPSSESADAHSQPDLVQAAVDKVSGQLREKTYNLLAHVHDWPTFSNHTTSTEDSLEAIHDLVHLRTGGAGHMGLPVMSGFDPLFFLHHTNVGHVILDYIFGFIQVEMSDDNFAKVDRIIALWQAINPNIWVVPGDSQDGTGTIQPGTEVDVFTDLTPFHVDDTTFWKSASSYRYEEFGSTYVEVSDKNASPSELKKIVTEAVTKLYGPRRAPRSESGGSKEVAGDPSTKPGPLYPSDDHRDWIVTVSVSPHEFARSAYIHIFLCKTVPSENWTLAPELVGDVAIFRNTSGQCDNCNEREAAGEIVSGHVPLTSALLERKKDLNDEEDITAYLKTHMHWRCELVDGTEVPLENVPSLKVRVSSAPISLSEHRGGGVGFPKRGTFKNHHSITHGRVGGFGSENE